MIGEKFELFGTSNMLKITGQQNGYWIVTIESPTGQEINVLITKQDLQESVTQGSLVSVASGV